MSLEQLIRAVTAELARMGCDQITHTEGNEKSIAFLFHAPSEVTFSLPTPGWTHADMESKPSPLGLWCNLKFIKNS